jgi:para-nitrobenzyl esterase
MTGPQFAKQGVIVVTVNYRMGRAGWFAHPALTKENPNATANFGLMDQVASLKWVRDNIAAFGGNTKNVTIFGESAGAISVNYLMVDPNARGLFQKAISESGFGRLGAKPLKGAGSAEETGEAWTKGLGITGADAATAKKMRALTWDDLKKGPLPLGSVGPIADGHMITDTAVKEFAQGKQAKVPYILGGNSDEASLTRSTTNVAARIQQVSTAKDAFAAAFDPDKTGANDRAVGRLVTDELISEPDRALARIHSKAGAPTWVYHFSYADGAAGSRLRPAARGEIPYVFNTPAARVSTPRGRPSPRRPTPTGWPSPKPAIRPPQAAGLAQVRRGQRIADGVRPAGRASRAAAFPQGPPRLRRSARRQVRTPMKIDKRLLIGGIAALALAGAGAVQSQQPAPAAALAAALRRNHLLRRRR